MKKLSVSTCLLLTLVIGGPVLRAQNAPGATKITHVLVISIDGMHSQDLAKWVSANPSSTLAKLTATGVNYTSAFTTQPSDSIPSTVGIFTGASPALGGMYYDDAWHRAWSPPGSNCTTTGTAIDLKNGIDKNPLPPLPLAATSIDPNKLPLDPNNGCLPVFPHNMMRVNTIFEVISGAGMYTAYSEKRPSYDFLNGPSGVGVQDLYTPEIASYNLLDPTLDLTGIETFDDLRVASVLNEINELKHDGTAVAPLPALFGMNFQAVNSAKKSSTTSGYVDSAGTPDAILLGALSYVDNSIGRMLSAFPSGQLKKTAIIITAKHGESPFGNQRTIVLTSLIGSILKAAGISTQKITQKTTALIWLTDQTQTAAAVAALNASPALAPNLSQVLSFGSAGFPPADPTVDPAVPDIFVVMNKDVNFEPSGSTTFAEHGGFGENETHVPLLISNPGWTGSSLTCTVSTRQIAPTVLKLLGLDPNALQAVQIEGTAVLPFTQACQ
jgi:hypothetical protein